MDFENNNFVITNKDDVIHPEETTLSKTGEELFKGGQENYYFKENNIKVQEIHFSTDNKTAAPLNASKVDVSATGSDNNKHILKSLTSTASIPGVLVTVVGSITVIGTAAGIINIKPINKKVTNFLSNSTELGFEFEKEENKTYKMLLTNEEYHYSMDVETDSSFIFNELMPNTVYDFTLYDIDVTPSKVVFASSYMTKASDNYTAVISNTQISKDTITFDIAYEGENIDFVTIDVMDENDNVIYHYEGARINQVTVARTEGSSYNCKVAINGKVIHLEALVNEEVVVPVSGVTLNKTSLDLKVGEKETLLASVLPTNATNKDVIFSSSKEDVATINEKGEITALKKGNTNIKVTTVDGGYIATCRLRVSDATVPVTGVSISEDSIELNVRETKSLSVTVLPTNASNKNVTFESSNPRIASVDENGLITAHSVGETTIVVTTVDGGYKDFVTVTIVQ